ncbi:ExeA family protein [Actibacterium lipolyticum]|uniref:Archaeal ATPase n=1 Tax=Actibacterium lipolyticum TaxID=1524263 RepID=A0A238KUT2_9RHOB|nr:AAA family ATPase [Actibacterium lipolyticum]SMX46457.1 Archaeal ATPase [Actibacterium lipolyticum]
MSRQGLYTEFYNLKERPFTLLPDPDFIYWTGPHKRAFTVLEYAVLTNAPISVVTGEVGVGKTTLVQALLASVDEDITIGLVSNAHGGRGELLRWALNAFGEMPEQGLDYVSLFQALQDFILTEYASGRRCVLVIDEAQNLSTEALEELRMLTNINANKDELLQLILVGQPELLELITKPELRQFAQRVVASYHIPAMTRESFDAYVKHRLVHAGGTGAEFSEEALDRIYSYSDGIPRLVNKLCDFSMVYAASSGEKVVSEKTVLGVIDDSIFIETRNEEVFTTGREHSHKAAE